ncbi:TatD family hydrolase [Pseudomonas nicosulfuronedens]|uniref:TatD family deoxyribonuclease n=1 Tax=Pseudomonas nicosulfuronedens TaxID=2571105 RepID=A0A5R9R8V1_9PSED|nr:TatD family hydrolase [Pseudomonas nicosulfuronedens]MDH1007812.1 TatD family hydrolase [Pseudomonas nicosulfuronedens]MDH1982544.1 TatD family hydrolase [Pseudomonas nicosulfuronedens]MDH2024923.1 TatD family hydrolase [Pseudomonas nicosulfuronedens]TLX79309.1 TatD family deoxyribonuclease [Pseudomonas nicosulfuronedens]
MRLIDTHNHLDCPDFEQDRAAVLQRSRELGVERQVLLGVFRENWEDVWALVESEPDLYAALGLHPIYLARHRPEHLTALRDWLQRLAGHPKLCAVGEIGLDYYLEDLDRDGQQAIFEEQLRIAIDFELPVLLHVRRAHAAMIATLKRFKPKRQGIVHAFAGSREEAREYLKLGFRLGLGGAPTWPQANRLRKVVPEIPLESIVLETDSPDMAPSMYPGVRNSPEHLPDICVALAELKGISPEELASASTRNAMELFGWR